MIGGLVKIGRNPPLKFADQTEVCNQDSVLLFTATKSLIALVLMRQE